MQKQKPACKDFIVAAARTLRSANGNAAPGVAAGVRINIVWKVARESYSWEEFVTGCNSLLTSGTVLITAKNKSSAPPFLLTQIPHNLPPPSSWRWPVSKTGELTNDPHAYTSSVKLYVVEDGLPEVVQKILHPRKKHTVTAREIIESIE